MPHNEAFAQQEDLDRAEGTEPGSQSDAATLVILSPTHICFDVRLLSTEAGMSAERAASLEESAWAETSDAHTYRSPERMTEELRQRMVTANETQAVETEGTHREPGVITRAPLGRSTAQEQAGAAAPYDTAYRNNYVLRTVTRDFPIRELAARLCFTHDEVVHAPLRWVRLHIEKRNAFHTIFEFAFND